MLLIIFLLLFIYISVFIALTFFLLRTDEKTYDISIGNSSISVLIPVRNEEQNLPKLIGQIEKIVNEQIEFVIVDDHSEDDTMKVLEQITHYKVKILRLPDEFKGKKQAVKYGLKHCLGNCVLFTDADTIISANWISTMVKAYEHADMILGPVLPDTSKKGKSFLTIFEYFDTLAMQLISFASTKAGVPFLASAANMAIKKDVAIKLYENINTNIQSGDDVFLLHEFVKHGKKVTFVFSKDSIVWVKPSENWKEFFKQRLRWVSKTPYYKLPAAIFMSWMIYLAHVVPLIVLALLFFFTKNVVLFIIFLVVKFLVDFVFMLSGYKYLKIPANYWIFFPFVWMIYFLYISLIPLLALIVPVKWKNR